MPQTHPLYVTLADFKSAVSIPTGLTDTHAERAIGAASRAIDRLTGRFFYKTDEETRTFTATSAGLVITSDIASITSVDNGDTTLAAEDYHAGPNNALVDEQPYMWLESLGNTAFSTIPGDISITGEFGWPVVPYQVEQMCVIFASKLFKRTREAPWGIVTTGTVEGMSIRIVRDDPDAKLLTEGLRRAETYTG